MVKRREPQQVGADPRAQSERLREARATIDGIDARVRALLSERKAVLSEMRTRLAACKHLDIPIDPECEVIVADPALDDVVSLLAPSPPSFRSEALRYLRSQEGKGATAAEIHQHVEHSTGRRFGRTTAPTTLLRLIGSGEIRQEGARYFAVVAQDDAPESASGPQDRGPDPGQPASKNEGEPKAALPSEVRIAARRVLVHRNEPLRARDILEELQKELRVSGANPLNSLQTTLGYAKQEFVYLKNFGYWPADLAYAPADYRPPRGDGDQTPNVPVARKRARPAAKPSR